MEILLWSTVAAGGTAVTWWGSDLLELSSAVLATCGVDLFTHWQDTMDCEPEVRPDRIRVLREWGKPALPR